MTPERLAKLRRDCFDGHYTGFSPAIVQDLIAEIDRLNSDAALVNQQVAAALERVDQAVRDKGYPVDIIVDRAAAFFGGKQWLLTTSRLNGRTLDCFGNTLNEAVDGLLAKIADLPPRWTPEQVAATLGIGAAA